MTNGKITQILGNKAPNKSFLYWLILGIAVLVAGGVIWWNWSITSENIELSAPAQLPSPSLSSPTVIYAEIKKYEAKEWPVIQSTDATFYSIKLNGEGKKKLFTIKDDEINIPDPSSNTFIKFCPATQKIYFKNENRYGLIEIKELNLNGNIRGFTLLDLSISEDWEYSERGIAISPDCQKIIWSIEYRKIENHKETDTVNEITVSDIDGQNRKILLTSQQSQSRDVGGIKQIQKWSSKDPDIIYIDGFDWNYAKRENLYRLNINTASLTKVEYNNISDIWFLSPDENFFVHSNNMKEGYFITNLKNGSKIFIDEESPTYKNIFSPHGKKFAYVIFHCDKGYCAPNLNVWDLSKKSKYLSMPNTNFLEWLSDDVILGAEGLDDLEVKMEEDASLVILDYNESKENYKKHLVTAKNLLYIGITKNTATGNSPEEKLYEGLDIILKAYKSGDDVKAKLHSMGLKYEPDRLPISIIAEGEVSNQMIDDIKSIGGDVAWFNEERIAVNSSIDIIERIANYPWVRYIFLARPPSIE